MGEATEEVKMGEPETEAEAAKPEAAEKAGEEEEAGEQLKEDIASLNSEDADTSYIEDGEEMFGEQPIEFSEEEEPTQVPGAGSETVSGVAGEEEKETEDEVGLPQQVEVNRIEIPNLYEFMQSLTELIEEAPKKKAAPAAQKKKRVAIGEEMDEEEMGEELDEELEGYGSAEDLEKKGSDAEILLLLDEVEDKPKLDDRKRKVMTEVVDIGKSSGVKDFLELMIDDAVIKSETVSPDAVLRLKLDRGKLSRAFKINVGELRDEHRKRNWLHKKVVDYYKRKKYNRALAEDNADTLLDNLKRYREVLTSLDKTMAREDTSRHQLNRRIQELADAGDELKDESMRRLDDLNKRLKEIALASVSVKTGQPMSEKAADAIIRKMTLLRTQISRLRLGFIKAQHKIAVLQNEARTLENIGDGLKMMEYESLRAETQELEDKLEERNNELSKIRERCTADAHLLCHIRERQFMLNCVIVKHNSTLFGLKEELNQSRTYLSSIKLERDRTRKKHNELSYQCGLLDKTNLLHDYDATVEEINKTEASVEKLKRAKKYYLEQLKVISKELGRPID